MFCFKFINSYLFSISYLNYSKLISPIVLSMLDKSVFCYYILGLCYSKTLIASLTYTKVLRTNSSNYFCAF